MLKHPLSSFILVLFLASLALSSCTTATPAPLPGETQATPIPGQPADRGLSSKIHNLTYNPRPKYEPGEMVDYVAQTGDTLPALAARFNTSLEEIRKANPFIPDSATTMPLGMPMHIPIYYRPFWGNPYQILPDSLFVNGPAQIGFEAQSWVEKSQGWLKGYRDYVSGDTRNGAQIVELVAVNYSISPRLLLALLEYFSGAVTQSRSETAARRPDYLDFPLGYTDSGYRGLYMQLVWAANTLNNGYYGWRTGRLTQFELRNGRLEYPDPWQNAATVALQYFFSRLQPEEEYQNTITSEGFAAAYRGLYGDPWAGEAAQGHIPGSLAQPDMSLPFQSGRVWALTGGPHTGWGEGEPFAALDFAPPSVVGGCKPTEEWVTAVADGVVVRSEPAIVVLDLDKDGDEHTGWEVFYMHVGSEGRTPAGAHLQRGDQIGHPSCEGGRATGTHVHIARKYNGEWIPAYGPLAFNLEGWVAYRGDQPYQGGLTRFSRMVAACECSDQRSQIISEIQP